MSDPGTGDSSASTPAAIAELRAILQKSHLIVTVGSGGVGKTTTAAAVALAAARMGRRCAVLTIDPARRLAQALGIEKMGNEPRALPAELVGPGSCDAMMLESPEAFDDLVARLVPDPARRDRLFENRLYQVIARHLGGTHEYMAVEKLFALMDDRKYDLVVLDTPPTVNALDFLDAPKRLSAFFSDKITRFFVRQQDEKRGIIQRLKDRAGEMAMSILGKALGEGFVEELMDFATAFQGLFGAFRERGLAAETILRDPGTAFVVVSGADPVRVAEAAEFTRTLHNLNITPRAFIANRVHVDGGAPLDVKALRTSIEALPGTHDVTALVAALQNAHSVRSSLRARDQRGLVAMARLAGRDKLLVVPELDDEVQDASALEHLLRALGLGRGQP